MEKALTLDPNSINAHYNLGLTYFETKQFELANEHAQRAYQLGASPPGLRDKLVRAKQWRPIDTPIPDAASSMGAEPKVSPDPH
jgi:tetratricopeptide (TPR) repeat protein